jgi:hypothetical protein
MTAIGYARVFDAAGQTLDTQLEQRYRRRVASTYAAEMISGARSDK